MRFSFFAVLFAAFLFSAIGFADEPAPASTPPTPDAAAPTAPPATSPSPKLTGKAGELQTYMEDLFEISKKVNSPDSAEKAKARARIDSSVDWDGIAQECLGKATWKKQPASNRGEFQKLLKDVILRTVYTRLDKFWSGGVTYRIDKVEVKGGTALIPAKFTSNGEDFELGYYLREKSHHWVLYDVSYSGVRYSTNISEQIDGFLKEKKFPGLLQKLKERRQELINDTKSDT